MQKFKSHKVVEAAKIKEIVQLGHNAATDTIDHGLILEDGDRVRVAADWLAKHTPKVGGYFVRYPDGYTSWSPAAAFEQGYTEASLDPKDGALPVSGYKPQAQANVALVYGFKADEERMLRKLDELATVACSDSAPIDWRWISIGRTHIEQGFMAINRAIFRPGRVQLPEDVASGQAGTQTVPFSAADVVNTPEAKAAFLKDAEASGDEGYIAHAKDVLG